MQVSGLDLRLDRAPAVVIHPAQLPLPNLAPAALAERVIGEAVLSAGSKNDGRASQMTYSYSAQEQSIIKYSQRGEQITLAQVMHGGRLDTFA